jgi:hypothetical protein
MILAKKMSAISALTASMRVSGCVTNSNCVRIEGLLISAGEKGLERITEGASTRCITQLLHWSLEIRDLVQIAHVVVVFRESWRNVKGLRGASGPHNANPSGCHAHLSAILAVIRTVFSSWCSSNNYSFRQDQTYYEKRVAATEIEMRGMSAEEDKSEWNHPMSVPREGSGLTVSLSAFHMIVIGLKERNVPPAREAGRTVVQMSLRVWHRSIGTKRVDKRMQTHYHLVALVLLPEDLGMREILRRLKKKHLFHRVCHSIGRRVWRKTCDRYPRERPGLFEGNLLLLQA